MLTSLSPQWKRAQLAEIDTVYRVPHMYIELRKFICVFSNACLYDKKKYTMCRINNISKNSVSNRLMHTSKLVSYLQSVAALLLCKTQLVQKAIKDLTACGRGC